MIIYYSPISQIKIPGLIFAFFKEYFIIKLTIVEIKLIYNCEI